MKKRYTLTLTVENVEAFQKVAEKMKLPPVQLSLCVDDFIKEITQTMEKLLEKGSFKLSDIFEMLAKQTLEVEKEELPDGRKQKKIPRVAK